MLFRRPKRMSRRRAIISLSCLSDRRPSNFRIGKSIWWHIHYETVDFTTTILSTFKLLHTNDGLTGKELISNIGNLTFNIAFLISGLDVAKSHFEFLVQTKEIKEPGFCNLIEASFTSSRSVVEDCFSRYIADIGKNVFERLTNAF